ncbi:MAG: tetratricopeptide repeat protein [Vicinamibacterales bacterium]
MPRARVLRPAAAHSRFQHRPVIAVTAFVALVIAGGAWWWSSRIAVPEPARLESLGAMDPEVEALLRELIGSLSADRRDATRWGRLGMAYEANGFIGVARQAYQTASRLAPDEPRWTYRLALAMSRLGDHDGALSAVVRTNELAPEYGPAWCRRGTWLLDRGDPTAAEAAFERARAIDAADHWAAIGLARVRMERRDNRGAAEMLERLLERQPGDRYALQLLGTAYRRLGRVDEASFALAVGAGGEPAWHDPWSEEVGEYRRGFAVVLKTATAEALAGRYDRALPMLETLRRRKPGDVALANHTAEVLTSAGRPGEAIRLLTSIVNERADNADTHLALASAFLASGEHARAGAHADRAIAAHAPGARALALKGVVAWRTGRRSEAARLFEQGLARDPRDARLLAFIGLIELEERRPREAAQAFSEVLRRDPLQADALAGLAMALHALGQRDEASLALARAEQMAPGHPRVREARSRLERPDGS